MVIELIFLLEFIIISRKFKNFINKKKVIVKLLGFFLIIIWFVYF